MAPKKPKPATDSIIGRRVRINADATYANGNTHAWAGFTGTVRVHNGRSVYQVEMEDGQASAQIAAAMQAAEAGGAAGVAA